MEKKQVIDVIRVKILELEDKLMDIIIISNNYENIPIPMFEQEINVILKKLNIWKI